MQRLVYLLSYPFLWLISILPFSVLYKLSDFIYFWIYKVFGYRKKVVVSNIKAAFPEKSSEEIKTITKGFYQHFVDIFLEMIKSLSISDKELKKRFKIKNPEVLEQLESQQKSYIIMTGHYASYEWINALHFYGLRYKAYGVYKQLKNKEFDRLVKKIRSKYNTTMLSTKEVTRQIIKNQRAGILSSYGMIADQAPKGAKSKYWRNFMGRKVPVFIGSEFIAKKLDLAVTYLHIQKVKRGYYEAKFIILTEHAKKVKDYQITDKYFELLEMQIKNAPAFYLWTHKRWKHAS
ncbi:lysophospholipid acyltransferase family protein [Mesonia maritima]|uniref:KDO2-lipid IV(A) lauroyltransferase n=1 Tax=Mesonia maritima TaxID=1793873 RepID=A0ABU1K696_9FLAO|nr:lysophospholipid acyltransferase family protein [Mesonia maritima]MDR6301133.1 KDO2-lipid IV(A) lauroyltransferase [Mesonia maritima]